MFQTHKTEHHLTADAGDVLAACFVMLHSEATCRTGTQGGATCDILDRKSKVDVRAGPQYLQFKVDAAVIVTAV